MPQNYLGTNISPNRPVQTAWFNSANFGGRSTYVDYFSAILSERGVPDPFSNPLPDSIRWDAPGAEFWDGFVRNNWQRAETAIDAYAFALQSYFFERSLITTGATPVRT